MVVVHVHCDYATAFVQDGTQKWLAKNCSSGWRWDDRVVTDVMHLHLANRERR